MSAFHYEEVNITEMQFEDGKLLYPCPCGDLFEMTIEALQQGSDVAQCPTCSLTIKVLYTEAERMAVLGSIGGTDEGSKATVVA